MDYTVLLSGLAGIGIGGALGWMRGKQLLAGAVSRPQYDAVLQEKTALTTKLDAAVADKNSLSNELAEARSERTELHERAVTLQVKNESLEQRLKEQQEQLKTEFRNTANAIFKTISTDFSTQSEKQIGDLLNPMRERLNEFKELVTKSFSDQGKEQYSLKTEIEKLAKASESMVLETDNLAQAIRGDIKAQGNWGEVMLERILEIAGLRKGIEYTVQGIELGLTDSEGTRQKPDYIIHLLDNKKTIIDSKVSLKAYEDYCNTTDEALKAQYLEHLWRSVKNHINELSGKRYQDNEKLITPDFVFMFMPIEGAFSLAVQHDPELQSYAWNKRVAIVCPNTLFASLCIVASLWRIEKQNKYADEIAKRGGLLYDQFAAFINEMQGIDKALKGAQKSYDAALKRLSEGRGVMHQVEKLKALGAKTSNSLPRELLAEEDALVENDMPKLVVN